MGEMVSSADKWIRSDSLKNLLSKGIPPGIGPDDARIIRKMCYLQSNVFRLTTRLPCYLIISSDFKDLNYKLRYDFSNMYKESKFIIANMNIEEYSRLIYESSWRREQYDPQYRHWTIPSIK